MKRKVLGLFLISIIVIGLTGCGNKSDNSKSSKKTSDSKEIELYPVKVEEMKDYRGRYGYVNKNGAWVIEPQYIEASAFDSETGLAKVRLPKGDYAVQYIDNKGKVVIDGCGSYSSKSFKNGYAVCDTNVRVKTYSTLKLIDKDGKEIIPSGQYERMTNVSKDGIIGVAKDTVSSMVYMKLDGTVIIEKPYSYNRNFINASMVNEKGYAYDGNVIFDMNGNEIDADGNIDSLNNNNYGFIENKDHKYAIFKIENENIKILSDYIYKYPKSFNDENYSFVHEDIDLPYYLINENGEKVNNKTYKNVYALEDGKWVVLLEDGSNQVLNPDGSILVNSFKVTK